LTTATVATGKTSDRWVFRNASPHGNTGVLPPSGSPVSVIIEKEWAIERRLIPNFPFG
jgi:hypothetical protein